MSPPPCPLDLDLARFSPPLSRFSHTQRERDRERKTATMSGAGAPDFFCREAQRLGYVARSTFKLLQMQKQYKLITPGASVLDLGCAPGAWLQVACHSLGPLEKGGSVIGIDIKKVKVPSSHCDSRVRAICADVMNLLRDKVKAMSPQEKKR